jgi:hypothetical protein
MKNADFHEMAYTELILSIDVRSNSGKAVFSIIKGYKSRDYTDGNSSLDWDKVKKNFDPDSSPSLVKTERASMQSKLEKGEDLDILIKTLESFF